MTRNILLALATVASLAAFQTTPAAAGGFLADTFVRPFAPQVATALDQAHANMGRPLDHAANAAAGAGANFVVPGSGGYVTGALEARDRFNRMNNGAPIGVPMAAPIGYPGGGVPMNMPMGNRCLLQNGEALFGPINPVGSPCRSMTPYGLMFGQVIQ